MRLPRRRGLSASLCCAFPAISTSYNYGLNGREERCRQGAEERKREVDGGSDKATKGVAGCVCARGEGAGRGRGGDGEGA